MHHFGQVSEKMIQIRAIMKNSSSFNKNNQNLKNKEFPGPPMDSVRFGAIRCNPLHTLLLHKMDSVRFGAIRCNPKTGSKIKFQHFLMKLGSFFENCQISIKFIETWTKHWKQHKNDIFFWNSLQLIKFHKNKSKMFELLEKSQNQQLFNEIWVILFFFAKTNNF